MNEIQAHTHTHIRNAVILEPKMKIIISTENTQSDNMARWHTRKITIVYIFILNIRISNSSKHTAPLLANIYVVFALTLGIAIGQNVLLRICLKGSVDSCGE